jgi:hypothetical protein
MPVPQRILQVTVGQSGTGGMRFAWPTFIEVETEHTADAKPNSAKIKLHNLSPGEISWCEVSGQVAQVIAGEGVASPIAIGDIRRKQVITESLASGGTVTTLEARDGFRRYIDSVFARSYPPGTTRDLIMSDVLSAMQLPIGYRSPGLAPLVFPMGYTFSGKARHCMDELVAMDVGTWTIQGGRVYIFAPHDPQLAGTTPILSADTGLMGSPKRRDRGWIECRCRLQPAFNKIWMGFQVQSRWVNGIFKVAKIAHKATSDGATWETSVEGMPVTT